MSNIKEKLVELLRGFFESVYPEFVYESLVDHLIANGVTILETNLQETCDQSATDTNVGCKWISVDERLPDNFVSVLGYMTDAGEFPPVRECYTVGNAFFFPALGDVHPVSRWCEMPEPPKGE